MRLTRRRGTLCVHVGQLFAEALRPFAVLRAPRAHVQPDASAEAGQAVGVAGWAMRRRSLDLDVDVIVMVAVFDGHDLAG